MGGNKKFKSPSQVSPKVELREVSRELVTAMLVHENIDLAKLEYWQHVKSWMDKWANVTKSPAYWQEQYKTRIYHNIDDYVPYNIPTVKDFDLVEESARLRKIQKIVLKEIQNGNGENLSTSLVDGFSRLFDVSVSTNPDTDSRTCLFVFPGYEFYFVKYEEKRVDEYMQSLLSFAVQRAGGVVLKCIGRYDRDSTIIIASTWKEKNEYYFQKYDRIFTQDFIFEHVKTGEEITSVNLMDYIWLPEWQIPALQNEFTSSDSDDSAKDLLHERESKKTKHTPLLAANRIAVLSNKPSQDHKASKIQVAQSTAIVAKSDQQNSKNTKGGLLAQLYGYTEKNSKDKMVSWIVKNDSQKEQQQNKSTIALSNAAIVALPCAAKDVKLENLSQTPMVQPVLNESLDTELCLFEESNDGLVSDAQNMLSAGVSSLQATSIAKEVNRPTVNYFTQDSETASEDAELYNTYCTETGKPSSQQNLTDKQILVMKSSFENACHQPKSSSTRAYVAIISGYTGVTVETIRTMYRRYSDDNKKLLAVFYMLKEMFNWENDDGLEALLTILKKKQT